MHRGDDAAQIPMLDVVQLALEIGGVMVVHDGERAHHLATEHRALFFHQRLAHKVADDLAAVLRQTALRDELVEITPKSIRLRKRLLSAVDRKKEAAGKLNK